MNIPTLFDWLDYTASLRGSPAVYLVLITSFFIAIFWDWRISLLALIGQYLFASLLFVDLLDPRLAIIKVFVGMFVCLILYLTARQINYGRAPADFTAEEINRFKLREVKIKIGRWAVSRNFIIRLIASISALLVIGLLIFSSSLYLPGIPEDLTHINQAILILMALGLVGIATSHDPLPAGMGLFTFLTGFELYYAVLEQSIAMLAALAALNLTLALAVSYLAQAQRAAWYALNDD